MADIKITTENSAAASQADARRRRSHRGPLIIAAALGCMLFALGTPRLIAAFVALNARDVLWAAYNGASQEGKALEKAAALIADASRWALEGELETDRGFLLLRAAERAEMEYREELLARAETATTAGLAAAPGQPSAWLRLAYMRELRGDDDGAAAALRLSILSGAVAPAIMVSRLELALRLPRPWAPELESLVKRQLALTWVIAPDFIAALSRNPENIDLVRTALNELSAADIENYARLHTLQ